MSLFIGNLWIFIFLGEEKNMGFRCTFYNNFHNSLHSTSILLFYSSRKAFTQENVCTVHKNRRTKGVRYRRSLSSFALKFDVSPLLSSYPFFWGTETRLPATTKGHLTVFHFSSFTEWYVFLIIAFFELSPVSADLIEVWAKKHWVLV